MFEAMEFRIRVSAGGSRPRAICGERNVSRIFVSRENFKLVQARFQAGGCQDREAEKFCRDRLEALDIEPGIDGWPEGGAPGDAAHQIGLGASFDRIGGRETIRVRPLAVSAPD